MFRVILLLVLICLPRSIRAQNSRAQKWESNYNNGVKLIIADSLNAAYPYVKTAFDIAQTNFEQSTPEFQNSIIEYANYYTLKNDYSNAIRILGFSEKYDSLFSKTPDVDDFKTIHELAKVFKEKNKHKSSINLYNTLLPLVEKNNDFDQTYYALILRELSEVYLQYGTYKKSKSYALESQRIFKQLKGETSKDYIDGIGNLTSIYIRLGEYDKALINQKFAYDFYEKVNNKGEDFATASFWMSYLSNFINDYESEISYLKTTIEIFGENHPYYPIFIGNLGLSYQYLGDYENALNYIKRAVDLHADRKSAAYSTLLQNLAYTYVSLGEYEKAEQVYNNALVIWNSHLDTNHDDYGRLLNNIGKMYREIAQYDKAKVLFKKSIDNFLKHHDKNHRRYGYLINDYATMLSYTGEKTEALNLLEENLRNAIADGNTVSEGFYGRQLYLAKAYIDNNEYEKAIPLLESAKVNMPQILGENHIQNAEIQNTLAKAYLGLKDLDEALPLIESSNAILLGQIDQIFQFRSESEKKALLKKLSSNFDDIQAIALNNSKDNAILNSLNINNQLVLKGLLLENSKGILPALSQLNDKEIDQSIIAYKTLKSKLTKLLTNVRTKDRTELDSIENLVNTKETELVKLYNFNFKERTSLLKDWAAIKSNLKSNEVCIEFAHFNAANKEEDTSIQTHYVAYVFDQNSKAPAMIPLFLERELKAILKDQSPNALYRTRGSIAKGVANNKQLYQLIWKPLEAYLKSAETVYYAPSGLLNQVAQAALKNKDQLLIDAFKLIQLSSTSKLLDKSQSKEITNVLLYGGIQYDYDKIPSKDTTENELQDSYSLVSTISTKSRGTKNRGDSWDFLRGTLDEVNAISKKLKAQDITVTIKTKSNATEENFKGLSGKSPDIIHLATHGFFFENLSNSNPNVTTDSQLKNPYRMAEDPLLRSGLLMTGANYAWKNGHNPYQVDDGILTAMEIANLDLSETKLVVLSACETGLGDIDGSEGVYGLQRAFKMAGVDKLIMSLWEVPDKETSEFMQEFYGNWLSGLNIQNAFIKTQRKLAKTYKNEPNKWAAFVLFE